MKTNKGTAMRISLCMVPKILSIDMVKMDVPWKINPKTMARKNRANAR